MSAPAKCEHAKREFRQIGVWADAFYRCHPVLARVCVACGDTGKSCDHIHAEHFTAKDAELAARMGINLESRG